MRGFLDLLTVTFMGRYAHRPLHLFGGLGLVLGLVGAAILSTSRWSSCGGADRPPAAPAPRRAARRRRDPAPLARPALRALDEPARERSGERGAHPARRRDLALTSRRGVSTSGRTSVLPAQHPGRPPHAGRRRRGRRAPPCRCGRTRTPDGRPGRERSPARAAERALAARRPRGRRGRRRRRLSGALRHARRPARGRCSADRLQSARLAPRHARRRPRAVPARFAGCSAPPTHRPAGVPARRSRRCGHRGSRGVLRPHVRRAAGTAGGLPGRRRRAVFTGWSRVPSRCATSCSSGS